MIRLGPHYSDSIEALERHGEKYDFYEGHDGSNAVGHFAPWALSHVYDVRVIFLGDAERQLPAHATAGGTVVLSPGHTSDHDPTAIGAGIGESEAFKPVRGKMDVMAKEGVARIQKKIPGTNMNVPLLNRAMRIILDNFVSLDTYRGKDIKRFVEGIEDPEERAAELVRLFALKEQSDERQEAEIIRRLDIGRGIGIFSEGERRGRDNYLHVEPPKDGIWNVSTGTTRSDEVLVFPMAVDFSRGENGSRMHPDIIVGEGFPVQGTTKVVFLKDLHDSMQACVDESPTGLAAAA